MVRQSHVILYSLLLVLWLVLSSIKSLPGPIDVTVSFITDLPVILLAIINSLKVIFISFGLSFILVFVLVYMSQKAIIHEMVDQFISICHPIPGIALLPIVMILIGIGNEVKVVIVVHAVLWPLLINVKNEVFRVKLAYEDLLQVYRVKTMRRLFSIYFLGAMPGIISGTRIAFSRAWRAIISIEMIFSVVGTSQGIGFYIFEKRVWGQHAHVFAGIIAIVIMSLFIERYFFDYLEKKMIKTWINLE